MANSRRQWRGVGVGYTGCRDSPGAAPCSIGKTFPPGPQRPHPPAETALLSTARRGGAEPFLPLWFFSLTFLRNGKWPPLPTAAATIICPETKVLTQQHFRCRRAPPPEYCVSVRPFPGRPFCRRCRGPLAPQKVQLSVIFPTINEKLFLLS